ncbi:hypothetical protein P9112_009778 [Eukaryota sp. TZLM1-RC]
MSTRILKEIRSLQSSPPPGVVFVSNEHTQSLLAEIAGSESTPYVGKYFLVRLRFPSDFPRSPPTAVFETPIFHPNISPTGDVCVNTLKRDWTSETTISHVLQTILCLLIEPFPESALNETAAKLALEDYNEYFRRAQLHSKVHARSSSVREANQDGGKQKARPVKRKTLSRL